MSNVKKLMMTAAGAGAALNVEDVFSTYLYGGTGSSQTITNSIDLSGEGGMVWIKHRNGTASHTIHDTERGATYRLITDSTAAQFADTDEVTSFNSDGFTVGSDAQTGFLGRNYASWTFRKAPKFFDVVTYTGNGTNRTISHNLGTTPGCMIIKASSGNYAWAVYHRGHPSPQYQYSWLQSTQVVGTLASYWNSTDPTDSVFSLGTNATVNANGVSYVAYLFAHNDGDGTFGPTADQDIIKCGSYTGNGSSSTGTSVDLGFEPQWVLVKNTSTSGNWELYDVMRGMIFVEFGDTVSNYLRADSIAAENGTVQFYPTGSGFTVLGSNTNSNSNGHNFIYIAIRRGPMAPPESADEVFAIATQNEVSSAKYGFYAGFPVDMAWKNINTGEGGINTARIMQGKNLRLNTSESQSGDTYALFDDMESYYNLTSTDTNRYSWMFKRAAGFFDVAAWKGSSASSQALNHSLGVAPEMIWAKNREDTDGWIIYHKDLGNGGGMTFQSTSGYLTSSAYWNNTTPSDSTFTVGNTLNFSSSFMYIGYLFATLNGVSKVGSYTGNGSSQTIDCGFSSGASFVLVKRYDTAGNWTYWDSKRGIVAGNDTSAKINGNDGFVSDFDDIDPTNSGFIINQNSGTNFNVSGGTYIFYAIAAI